MSECDCADCKNKKEHRLQGIAAVEAKIEEQFSKGMIKDAISRAREEVK
jgi:hypothetical protein